MSPTAKRHVHIKDDFLRDLLADYRAHGAAAIASLRRDRPLNYFELVRSFLYAAVPAPASLSGDGRPGMEAERAAELREDEQGTT